MADETRAPGDGATPRNDHEYPRRQEGSPAPFMLNPHGHVASWSPAAERLTGYRAAEIVGKPCALLEPPEPAAAEEWKQLLAAVAREGFREDERWRVRRDGSCFLARLTLNAALDGAGQVSGFVGLLRDLTAERAATERLARSDHQMSLLVDSVTDYAIFMLDANGRVATWNAGAERIKGYLPHEVIGRDITTFYTPEDRAAGRAHRLLRQAREHGRVEDQGWRLRKDGTRFWADVVISALRDPSGGLVGYGKVTRDLTERRSAEERLLQSEERFRLLVEQVSEYAIFMLDPRGVVTTWNVGAQRIKGYRTNEILGCHFSRFYEPQDVLAGKCEQALALAVAEERFEEEGWRIRKDSSRFWASVLITPLRSAGGELLGFAKITRDLTERRSAEAERMRRARAEESVRLRDEFLAIASHELKTPLTALQLQLQSLQERVDSMDANLARKLERATRSGTRLSSLIESLTDVSLMAVGRFVLTCAPFDMSVAIEHLLESLRSSAQKVGSELLLETPGAMPGVWDRIRVEQVVTNLVANAIKYGAGKPIAISLGRSGDQLVLEVRDGGPGLAEQDLVRIFARFERGDVSLRHYGGLGLGLYLTREIVEAHGGAIAARNLPQGGAAFMVRLPFDARLSVRRAGAGSEVH